MAVALALIIASLGCEASGSHPRSALDQKMFGPASVRLHPTFTQVRDWSGSGKPDGIEATLEIQDQFGEPTRTTGRAMFELFNYQKESPRVRGRRIAGPWIASLDSKADQQEHWNSALRAYTFQLHYPMVRLNEYYVLTVQFDLNSTTSEAQPATATTNTNTSIGRLFDQLIIEPKDEEKKRGHYHAPTQTPGR